jgi:anti-sigma B factor antagonist
MPLTITTRIDSDGIILDISGRLCFLEVALVDRVNKLLDDGHRDFVLNLAEVPYIDSFGLGQLIAVWSSIEKNSGQMTLLRPTDFVRKLFQITKLDSVFHLSKHERAST